MSPVERRRVRDRERKLRLRTSDPTYRERQLESTRKWYAKHRERISAERRLRYASDSEHRAKIRLSQSSIDPELYSTVLKAQGGVCAICSASTPGEGRTLFLADHDHRCCPTTARKSCGKCIRGLLCSACNRGLGCFKDDPTLHTSAAVYLLNRKTAPGAAQLPGQ
jgi:hypothetical protein